MDPSREGFDGGGSGLRGLTVHVPGHIEDGDAHPTENRDHVVDLPLEPTEVVKVDGLFALAARLVLHPASYALVADFGGGEDPHADVREHDAGRHGMVDAGVGAELPLRHCPVLNLEVGEGGVPEVGPVEDCVACALHHMPLGLLVHPEAGLKLVYLEDERPPIGIGVVVGQVGVPTSLIRAPFLIRLEERQGRGAEGSSELPTEGGLTGSDETFDDDNLMALHGQPRGSMRSGVGVSEN